MSNQQYYPFKVSTFLLIFYFDTLRPHLYKHIGFYIDFNVYYSYFMGVGLGKY